MDTQPPLVPPGHQAGGAHETTDARPGWIFAVLFLLGIGLIAMHFVMVGVFNVFQKQPAPSDRWPARARARQAATAWTNRFPSLQVNPPVDLNRLRTREEAQLNSYGWIDPTAGVVRIPVTRAIDLLLEKGLPVRQGTNQDATGPSSWELQEQRASGDGKAQEGKP